MLKFDEMDKGTLLWFIGALFILGPVIYRYYFSPAVTPFLIGLGDLFLILGIILLCVGLWLMNKQRRIRNLVRRKFGWTSIKKKA